MRGHRKMYFKTLNTNRPKMILGEVAGIYVPDPLAAAFCLPGSNFFLLNPDLHARTEKSSSTFLTTWVLQSQGKK